MSQVQLDGLAASSDVQLNDASAVLPATTIHEHSNNSVRFNVLTNRFVEETLHVEKYEVWPDRVLAHFSRTYHSDMVKSPDHLIFLTALVHLQKLIYILMCYRLGVPYEDSGRERIKIWPTKMVCKMSKLVRRRSNLTQSLTLEKMLDRGDGSIFISGKSKVGTLSIAGEALVFRLKDEH